ncbi:MAG: hypothetical protein PHQ72_04175 [Hespellia sp.]|nr:hypothetical protein [Hespellia sp.]
MKNRVVRQNFWKITLKYVCLFLFFGTAYFGIECLWRWSLADWRMAIMGGFIAVLIGMINNLFSNDTSLILQCILGALLTTLAEAILGTYWRQRGIFIWDYSSLPLTYVNGNVNLLFSMGWFLLSGLCIILDDTIRWLFFHEKKPHYKLR